MPGLCCLYLFQHHSQSNAALLLPVPELTCAEVAGVYLYGTAPCHVHIPFMAYNAWDVRLR